MIKCYFIDVINISSDLPRSSFSEAELDRLADSILASDGLLRPLILKENSVEKYAVIEGHREYYAAVRAKEKDLKKAEMVNAFVINTQMQRSTIDQLNLLKDRSDVHTSEIPIIDRHTLAELLSSSVEQLLPAIAASISMQLQPIVSQVAEHQQILAQIKLDQIKEPNTGSQKTPDREIPLAVAVVAVVEQPQQDVKPLAKTKSTTNRNKKPKTEDTSSAQSVVISEPNQQLASPEIKPVKVNQTTTKSNKKAKTATSVSSTIPVGIESPQQPIPAVKSAKITKQTEAKKGADALESIDSTKSTNALKLINTLSQDLLTLRMERSAVSKAIVKSVASIIVKRNNQPEQKFDTWEDIIAAKITGLSTGRIQEIIEKLK